MNAQAELFAESRPWADVALEAVYGLALSMPMFTVDDIWARLKTRTGTRALGSVINRARQNGWIAPTDMVQASTRPECNARKVPVWRSLLVPQNVSTMMVTVKLSHADASWLRDLVRTANPERGSAVLMALDTAL